MKSLRPIIAALFVIAVGLMLHQGAQAQYVCCPGGGGGGSAPTQTPGPTGTPTATGTASPTPTSCALCNLTYNAAGDITTASSGTVAVDGTTIGGNGVSNPLFVITPTASSTPTPSPAPTQTSTATPTPGPTIAIVSGQKAANGTLVNPTNAAPVSQANGGWGALDELGSIGNAGTATCNFSGTTTCHFTSGTTPTIANPTNLPTNAFVVIAATYTGGDTAITWGSNFLGWADNTGWVTLASSQWTDMQGGTNATNTWTFWSDGTHLTLAVPMSMEYRQLRTQGLSVVNAISASGGISIGGDTTATANSRAAYAFSLNQQTALLGNEHMGTFLTVKPITFDNATVDEQNVTCAVNATVTVYDCGTSAGPCTSGQTSTIWTSPSITTALSGTSIAGGALTTATVAAGHYVTAEVTAGTCAAFGVQVALDYKMQ